MRKFLILMAALAGAVTFVAPAAAADSPFPSPKAGDVFVAAQTVTTDGAMANQFAPGQTVVFRAYAVVKQTKEVLAAKDVRYFYVTIPGQPNVKLKYDPKAAGATARMSWVGTWQVPATFRSGLVPFKVLVQTKNKLRGMFVQFPVASAMLTITATPQIVTAGPPAVTGATPDLTKQDLSLYVDTVNGSRPPGAKPRATGCTQTNVYKRGEQVVVRAWGFDLTTGALLSSENVAKAEFTVPGQAAPVVLPYGPHGAADARVLFWAMFWNIPADYPLGEVNIKVTFTTLEGKTGTYNHAITIIPA